MNSVLLVGARNDLRVPLTLQGPARAMRGVPAPVAVTSSRLPAHLREDDSLAVVLAGAAAGYGGDRKRTVTGVPCAAVAAPWGSRPT